MSCILYRMDLWHDDETSNFAQQNKEFTLKVKKLIEKMGSEKNEYCGYVYGIFSKMTNIEKVEKIIGYETKAGYYGITDIHLPIYEIKLILHYLGGSIDSEECILGKNVINEIYNSEFLVRGSKPDYKKYRSLIEDYAEKTCTPIAHLENGSWEWIERKSYCEYAKGSVVNGQQGTESTQQDGENGLRKKFKKLIGWKNKTEAVENQVLEKQKFVENAEAVRWKDANFFVVNDLREVVKGEKTLVVICLPNKDGTKVKDLKTGEVYEIDNRGVHFVTINGKSYKELETSKFGNKILFHQTLDYGLLQDSYTLDRIINIVPAIEYYDFLKNIIIKAYNQCHVEEIKHNEEETRKKKVKQNEETREKKLEKMREF